MHLGSPVVLAAVADTPSSVSVISQKLGLFWWRHSNFVLIADFFWSVKLKFAQKMRGYQIYHPPPRQFCPRVPEILLDSGTPPRVTPGGRGQPIKLTHLKFLKKYILHLFFVRRNF